MTYAALADGLVASYSEKGYQSLQLKHAEILRTEVNNHLATLFLGGVAMKTTTVAAFSPPPTPPASPPPVALTHGPTAPTRGEKEKTWSEVAKRGQRNKPGTPNVGRAAMKTVPKPQKASGEEDLRVFFKVPSIAKQSRDAYPLRRALLRELPELVDGLAEVKEINTGWAAYINTLAARDLLLTPGNLEKAYRVFGTQDHSLPVTWYNYALPWTPSAVTALDGTPLNITKEMVADEAAFYTKKKPV